MKSKAYKVLAFAQNTRDEVRVLGRDGNVCGTISASLGMKQQAYVRLKRGGDDEPKQRSVAELSNIFGR